MRGVSIQKWQNANVTTDGSTGSMSSLSELHLFYSSLVTSRPILNSLRREIARRNS